jgi:hypothetical protein
MYALVFNLRISLMSYVDVLQMALHRIYVLCVTRDTTILIANY